MRVIVVVTEGMPEEITGQHQKRLDAALRDYSDMVVGLDRLSVTTSASPGNKIEIINRSQVIVTTTVVFA